MPLRRRHGGLPPLIVLLAGMWGSSGCAAAGLAAVSPMLGALHAVVARRVERTVPADLPTAWAATVDTSTRMDLRIRAADRMGETWTLEAESDMVTLHAELVPVTSKMTRLSLRVEAGRLLADKQTGEEILNQVAASLAGPTAVAHAERLRQDAQATALATLQQEIQHLRTQINQKQEAHRPSQETGMAKDPVVFWGSGILVVPSSYGTPTIGGEASGSVPGDSSPRLAKAREPVRATTLPRAKDDGSDVPAAPLNHVGALPPVSALGSGQAGH